MVPVAQWLERVTVDDEVEGSTPFRHPRKEKEPERAFLIRFINCYEANIFPHFNSGDKKD